MRRTLFGKVSLSTDTLHLAWPWKFVVSVVLREGKHSPFGRDI